MAAAGPLVSTTVSATAKPTITAPTPIPAGRRHHGLPPDAPDPDPDRPGGSDGGPAGGVEEPDPPVGVGTWPASEAPPVGAPDSGPEGGPDGLCTPSCDAPEEGGGGRRPEPLDGGGAGGSADDSADGWAGGWDDASVGGYCGAGAGGWDDASVGGYCEACVGGCGAGSFSSPDSPEEGGCSVLKALSPASTEPDRR